MFIDCVSVYSSLHCFEVKRKKKKDLFFMLTCILISCLFDYEAACTPHFVNHLTMCSSGSPWVRHRLCVFFLFCGLLPCAWLFRGGFVVVFYLSPSVLVLPPSMDQWWPRQWVSLPNTAYFILIGLAHRHFLWSLSGSEQVKIYIHTVNILPTFIPLEVRQYLCKGMVWKMYLYRILWLCVNISIHWKNWSS